MTCNAMLFSENRYGETSVSLVDSLSDKFLLKEEISRDTQFYYSLFFSLLNVSHLDARCAEDFYNSEKVKTTNRFSLAPR